MTTTREKYVLRQEGGSLFERMKIGDGEERRGEKRRGKEGGREGETQGMKGRFWPRDTCVSSS